MKKNKEVIKWIPAKDDYIIGMEECPFDKSHYKGLIKELVKKKYIICGDTHQSSDYNCIPVFEDGYLLLSMRRWAEIMRKAYMRRHPFHSVPNFYMVCVCSIKEELPE